MKRRFLGGLCAALAAAILLLSAPQAVASMRTMTFPSADDTGTIVVTKHVQAATVKRNGSPQPGAVGQGVAGVEFAVAPVLDAAGNTYDLTTAEGWQAAEALRIGAVTHLGPIRTEITNEFGVATFRDLRIGVYLVWETTDPAQAVTGIAQPTLVAVPMPNPATSGAGLDQGSWLYEVYLYPKNYPTDGPQPTEPPSPPPTEPPATPPSAPVPTPPGPIVVPTTLVPTSLIPTLALTPGQPQVSSPSLGPDLPPKLALTGADARTLVVSLFLVIVGGLCLVDQTQRRSRRTAPAAAGASTAEWGWAK